MMRLRASLIGALRAHVMPSQRSLNPIARALDDLRLLVTLHHAKRKAGRQKCIAYPDWGLTQVERTGDKRGGASTVCEARRSPKPLG